LSLDPYEEKPEQLESGGKALNKRIKDIIGLDADQFEKTILIPQGKFEDLLNHWRKEISSGRVPLSR
jgi:DNA repair exonuclease SbcCD ATPase subunit